MKSINTLVSLSYLYAIKWKSKLVTKFYNTWVAMVGNKHLYSYCKIYGINLIYIMTFFGNMERKSKTLPFYWVIWECSILRIGETSIGGADIYKFITFYNTAENIHCFKSIIKKDCAYAKEKLTSLVQTTSYIIKYICDKCHFVWVIK